MKLKLDENLGRAVKRFFEERGIDVVTVREQNLQGTTDGRLLPIAASEGRILVTLDRGFGNYHLYCPGSHAGIIVLRPRWQTPQRIISLLEKLFSQVTPDKLEGAVVIVGREKIRIFRFKGGNRGG